MKGEKSILIPALVYTALLLLMLLLVFLFRHSVVLHLMLVSGLLITVLAGLVGFIVYIYYPLASLKERIKLLSGGEPLPRGKGFMRFEFGEMNKAIDQHAQRLQEVTEVAHELADGKAEKDFETTGEQDELGRAIIRLKKSILHSKKDEQERRRIDEQQYWTSRGLARFGELLRDFDHQKLQASEVFIMELVKYTGLEIGGLFLAEKDEQGGLVLNLTGAYAFDRIKQLKKTFAPGEGLVGRCAIEKQTILITDVPPDYLCIRSGLGENSPSTILLVPIMYNEDVLGVIELASFIEMEDYKVSFLESLGRSAAPVLARFLMPGK